VPPGCDLFVLPTHQEALGQSHMEAMAAGLPVIGTDVDGVPEIISHGINGLLVPPHDIKALRAAIARLIDNPRRRVQFGVAGRLLTDVSFTVDGMADETIDFYERGISERRLNA
jgi:glycosyltransferase involved in cell wall biosynthesis